MIKPNFLKKITIKKILIFVVLIFIISEIINISTDIYNFRKLEKVKIILKDLKYEDKQFFNLREFNEIYSVNIKPISKCYYIRKYRSEDRVLYSFGFLLNSKVYKLLFGTEYYLYPKQNLSLTGMCFGNAESCLDSEYNQFIQTISNPCQD